MNKHLTPPCILYIDGGLPMQHLISYILEQIGCEVTLASNVWQAVAQISAKRSDLIVLNISDFATEMRVIKRIRAALGEFNQPCPMLAMATFPCPKMMAQARRYGVTHTLEGDIKADALCLTVEMILARYGSPLPTDAVTHLQRGMGTG